VDLGLGDGQGWLIAWAAAAAAVSASSNPEWVTNQPLDTASHFLIKDAKQPVVDPTPAEMAAPGIHF